MSDDLDLRTTSGAAESPRGQVAFVATDGVEQVELTEPWQAVAAAGFVPVLVSIDGDAVQAYHHLDAGDRFPVDVTAADASPEDYVGLVLPGGVANPDRLRTDPDVVSFVRDLATDGKPVAVICHGPWTLIEANLVRGRTITSWPSLHTDLANAGAGWVDREVVVCEHGPFPLVSSRKPDDLPSFCSTVVEVLATSAADATATTAS